VEEYVGFPNALWSLKSWPIYDRIQKNNVGKGMSLDCIEVPLSLINTYNI